MNKWSLERHDRSNFIFVQFIFESTVMGSIDCTEESYEAFMKVWGDGSDRVQVDSRISKGFGHDKSKSGSDSIEGPQYHSRSTIDEQDHG